MSTEQLAAIVASGLVNNKHYMRVARIGDYNLGRDPEYALKADDVARDAWAIACKLEELANDRNRNAR